MQQAYRIVVRACTVVLLSACAGPRLHPVIDRPTIRTTTFLYRTIQIAESDLVPLPHLSTTSPADRKRIDELIGRSIDLEVSGIEYNRATLDLEEFGKAAVPRVLNKLYETPLTTRDNLFVLNRLCRFLRMVTGERFGFNPAIMEDGADVGATPEARASALKQWFAFWAIYHEREDWRNMDEDPWK